MHFSFPCLLWPENERLRPLATRGDRAQRRSQKTDEKVTLPRRDSDLAASFGRVKFTLSVNGPKHGNMFDHSRSRTMVMPVSLEWAACLPYLREFVGAGGTARDILLL
jgi:hypothetical protein